jgi:hypothetical protein
MKNVFIRLRERSLIEQVPVAQGSLQIGSVCTVSILGSSSRCHIPIVGLGSRRHGRLQGSTVSQLTK